MRPSERIEYPEASEDESPHLVHILRSILSDMRELVLLEARLFGRTVLTMIALSIMMALLLTGAWLFFGAALVIALASLDAFSLSGATLTVGLVHLVLAVIAALSLVSLRGNLTFRESRASACRLFTRPGRRAQDDRDGETTSAETSD